MRKRKKNSLWRRGQGSRRTTCTSLGQDDPPQREVWSAVLHANERSHETCGLGETAIGFSNKVTFVTLVKLVMGEMECS